ncbi:hypothetical protein FUAX_52700 (plasmid) [Fulvitalea axinellae]|uniref:DUF4079 domain-containing protein n=1 Tax=Fulvitalea axinellae TaxID=1182444 RepID=A0AAU9CRQ6_9BACT|nr:hypothetical protein FUAX_52700 [Fulvitalea axinellae]
MVWGFMLVLSGIYSLFYSFVASIPDSKVILARISVSHRIAGGVIFMFGFLAFSGLVLGEPESDKTYFYILSSSISLSVLGFLTCLFPHGFMVKGTHRAHRIYLIAGVFSIFLGALTIFSDYTA